MPPRDEFDHFRTSVPGKKYFLFIQQLEQRLTLPMCVTLSAIIYLVVLLRIEYEGGDETKPHLQTHGV